MYFNYYFCYLSFLSVLDGTLSCTIILPAGINKSFSESIFDECTSVFMNIYAPINDTERKSFLEKVLTRLNHCGLEDF